MSNLNQYKLYQTIQPTKASQHPAGLSDQCDSFVPNTRSNGPRYFQCQSPAITRMVIAEDCNGLQEVRAVKRCQACANIIRAKAEFDFVEILEEQAID